MKNKKIILIICISILIIMGISIGVYFFTKTDTKSASQAITSTTKKVNINTSDVDWSSYNTKDITLSSSDIKITEGGVYNITGKLTNHSIIIETDDNVKLVLNDVEITSNNSPAIYVINAKNTYIELVGDNNITTTTTDDLDAAIYSGDDLVIFGSGSLTIKSNKDGIASKDSLTILSGTYKIKSEADSIKGKDSVYIKDGEFTLEAGEDGIHSNGDVVIDGGNINITSSDDGIHADGLVEINSGELDITAGEGIEGTYVKINDGSITIKASDDGINATNKSSDYTVSVEINGGSITINMGQGDTDGIDSNGNLYINGGTINITGQSPFDYDGEAKYTAGKMIVNGTETTEISNQFAGGGGAPGENINPGGNYNGPQRGYR